MGDVILYEHGIDQDGAESFESALHVLPLPSVLDAADADLEVVEGLECVLAYQCIHVELLGFSPAVNTVEEELGQENVEAEGEGAFVLEGEWVESDEVRGGLCEVALHLCAELVRSMS